MATTAATWQWHVTLVRDTASGANARGRVRPRAARDASAARPHACSVIVALDVCHVESVTWQTSALCTQIIQCRATSQLTPHTPHPERELPPPRPSFHPQRPSPGQV